jgi:hypothetical protein
VEDAIRHGNLVPLRLATGSFSGDEARIRLLYAESWSAVTFPYDRWGSAGMARLMEAFRDGAGSSDALREATGQDFQEFQQAWWEWLGGAPGSYPTPPSLATGGVGPGPTSSSTPAPGVATPSPAPAKATLTPEPSSSAWPCAGGAAAALVGLTAFLPASRVRRWRTAGQRKIP